jgi:electron transfer flavoprotein alpha/beta subunit
MDGLHLVVCLKSVPDPSKSAESTIDPKTGIVQRKADKLGIKRVISPLDRNALEQALLIKDAHGGRVTVLSMDTMAAAEVLKETLAMGADQAILLSDKALAGADTLATACALAAAIGRLGDFDLVLCGAWSYHGNTGQVGPQLAEMLGIPHISYAAQLFLSNSHSMRARSERDGCFTLYELRLPALVTVNEGINTPRQATMMGVVRARDMQVLCWGLEELSLAAEQVGLAGSPSRVTGVRPLPTTRRGEILEGDPERAVAELVSLLRAEGIVGGSRKRQAQ